MLQVCLHQNFIVGATPRTNIEKQNSRRPYQLTPYRTKKQLLQIRYFLRVAAIGNEGQNKLVYPVFVFSATTKVIE